MTISFVLNGEPISLDAIDPNTTLLHWLRTSGRTGTKEGCAEGECGACAVAWKATGTHGEPRWEVVNSCLVLLPSAHGRELRTAEGLLREGELHPVQACMAEAGGSQCGYCTPGFVVSLFGEYYRGENGPLDPESIAGNLCRCTGYKPIREAAEKLATIRTKEAQSGLRDAFKKSLDVPLPALAALHYTAPSGPGATSTSRTFERPTRLLEAATFLRDHPSAVIVSGGTDVVVEVNQRQRRLETVLSLEAIPELRQIDETPSYLTLGAGLSLASLEELLHGRGLPLLGELLPLFSSRLIRTRATLGGNLGTASPISDSPPVLLALDAEVELVRASVSANATGNQTGTLERRWVPLAGFFVAYRKTLLAPGELIANVRIPKPYAAIQRFYKVSKRTMDDISSVAAAFALDVDAQGRVTRARLAFGGVAATPIRLTTIEDALIGQKPDTQTMKSLATQAKTLVTPLDDHRASARYRREMVGNLLEKLAAQTGSQTDHHTGMQAEVSR